MNETKIKYKIVIEFESNLPQNDVDEMKEQIKRVFKRKFIKRKTIAFRQEIWVEDFKIYSEKIQ